MCWFSIARILLYVFNFVLFAAGATTLGLGIWIATNGSDSTELLGIAIAQNGAYAMIAVGSAALILGFLGCCGAKKKSTFLLGLYFFILLCLCGLQLAFGIWAAVNFDSADTLVDESLGLLDLTESDDVTTINNIGASLKCCGTTDDVCYAISTYSDLDCTCPAGTEHCGTPCGSSSHVYDQNCSTALQIFIEENLRIIEGIGIGIGLFEIFGLIFSMCMCQTLKESQGYS